MKFYRQSIILWGLLLPLGFGILLLTAGYFFKNKFQAIYEKNVAAYNSSEKDRKECLAIETKILPQRSAMQRWEKQIDQKATSTILPQLREIMADVNKAELQETGSVPSSSKGGFGVATDQNSSQMQISFRGTFRAMQNVLLRLETKFPQLHLNELKIDPNSNQSSLLNFVVSYTAWEN